MVGFSRGWRNTETLYEWGEPGIYSGTFGSSATSGISIPTPGAGYSLVVYAIQPNDAGVVFFYGSSKTTTSKVFYSHGTLGSTFSFSTPLIIPENTELSWEVLVTAASDKPFIIHYGVLLV